MNAITLLSVESLLLISVNLKEWHIRIEQNGGIEVRRLKKSSFSINHTFKKCPLSHQNWILINLKIQKCLLQFILDYKSVSGYKNNQSGSIPVRNYFNTFYFVTKHVFQKCFTFIYFWSCAAHGALWRSGSNKSTRVVPERPTKELQKFW